MNNDSKLVGADEPEVTAEMVSAGLAALWPCELHPCQDEAEVLAKVFRAMVKCRARSRPECG
jgi:hypothetical protein